MHLLDFYSCNYSQKLIKYIIYILFSLEVKRKKILKECAYLHWSKLHLTWENGHFLPLSLNYNLNYLDFVITLRHYQLLLSFNSLRREEISLKYLEIENCDSSGLQFFYGVNHKYWRKEEADFENLKFHTLLEWTLFDHVLQFVDDTCCPVSFMYR